MCKRKGRTRQSSSFSSGCTGELETNLPGRGGIQLREVCGELQHKTRSSPWNAGIASRNHSILAKLGRNGPFPAWTSNPGITPGRGELGWSSERAQGINSLWDAILFPSSFQLNSGFATLNQAPEDPWQISKG